MKERVDNIVLNTNIWVSTFHSTCVKILRRDIQHIGYDNSFTIYDSDDSLKLIKECIKQLNINEKTFPAKSVQGTISSAKNLLLSPKKYEKKAGDYYEQTVSKIYNLYQQKLISNNCLDFDDLIFKTVELFKTNEDVLDKYQNRFKYIMVDEYQDTNACQYELIKLLCAKYKNLCVVGDDDQSIYGWRGADIQNILDFEKDFDNVTSIKLEENYRSTSNILTSANEVVKNNFTRKNKTLWTKNQEGEKITYFKATSDIEESMFLSNTIKDILFKGGSYKDCCILYRNNTQSRHVEESFIRNNIPYRLLGGVRFYDRMEIKDILSYLKILYNPYDLIAFRRIINVPKRGVGEVTLNKIIDFSVESGISIFDTLEELDSVGLKGATLNKLKDFANIMLDLKELSYTEDISLLVETLVEKIKYIEYIKEKDGDIESVARIENVQELVSKAKQYTEAPSEEEKSLGGFLEEVALVADIDNYDQNDDVVTLMTLHSSKGLEFNNVFIIGFEENIFPSYRSITSDSSKEIEEERRLCYVGITRAKVKLYITSANSRMQYGNFVSNKVSRFYKELPEHLIEVIGATKKAPTPKTKYTPNVNKVKEYMKTEVNNTEFNVGDKVRQMKYGIGEVIHVQNAGKDTEVTVKFPKAGEKKFMAKLSKLKKV